MIYSSWDIECDRLKLVIMAHFLPFTLLLKTKKIRILKKWKKLPEIWSETDRIFFSVWAIFCLYTPLTNGKIKILKQRKKHLEMSSLYTCVSKFTIIWCILPEIWNEFSFFFFFCHFGTFLPFNLPNNLKNQSFEKMKKNAWKYYHFTIAYHKWWSYDVRFLRYGAWQAELFVISDYLLPFYPRNNPENQNFENYVKPSKTKILQFLVILTKI